MQTQCEWVPYTTEHSFNLVARSMVLLTGTESKVSDAFGFKIFADSEGRDDFSYRVSPLLSICNNLNQTKGMYFRC